ncbi:MAG: ion transporter [Leptospiraceae bacterium]|nr:ion transporter [Leptospiraceae bacterium]
MARRLATYIIGQLSKMTESSLFYFASLLIALASLVNLCLPLLGEISLQQEALLQQVDNVLLQMIAVETLGHLLTRQRPQYLRSMSLWIDLATISPMILFTVLANVHSPVFARITMESWAGIYIFKGVRALRLLPIFYFFYRKRQSISFESTRFSPLKQRFFTGISSLVFLIILITGGTIAWRFAQELHIQRQSRIQQLRLQAGSYGVLQAHLAFEATILGSWITRTGERIWIPGNLTNPEHLQNSLLYQRDYVQIDEIQPGQSVLLSLKDLHREQMQLELTILFSGSLIILSLLIILNHYLERLVIIPLQRSYTTNQLRLTGTELYQTLHNTPAVTEVTAWIQQGDDLYNQLCARAARL